MDENRLLQHDVALGARQLVIDTVLRALIGEASGNNLALGVSIEKTVNDYVERLDTQSELERDFVSQARAYVASLLRPA